MKAGDVRRIRWSGQLILMLRERDDSAGRRGWDCLVLESGKVEGFTEKWLIHDSMEWKGDP